MFLKLPLVLGDKLNERKELLDMPSQYKKLNFLISYFRIMRSYSVIAIKYNLGEKPIQGINNPFDVVPPFWVVHFQDFRQQEPAVVSNDLAVFEIECFAGSFLYLGEQTVLRVRQTRSVAFLSVLFPFLSGSRSCCRGRWSGRCLFSRSFATRFSQQRLELAC